MSLEALHEDHGATFCSVGNRRVPRDYGRPERAHSAVRNGVGLTEMPYGVLVVSGDDRIEYVDNIVSNTVPSEDGRGTYALLLDPQGKVELDMYVYCAGEQLLLFVPPGEATPLAEEWREKVFIQDVEISVATERFVVFGVHGPYATEKVASVLNGASTPDEQLSFIRGKMADVGVTVIRTDAPTGEEGYEVVCTTDETADEIGRERPNVELVFDALVTRGMNAAPFGRVTWESLTLEAGTPLFEYELRGEIPNVLGLRNALDFEKGCYVGQEVVSRVENRGQPSRRLAGLLPESVPEAGAAVFAGDEVVGEVTRGIESPSRGEPAAMALVNYDVEIGSGLTVRIDGEDVGAELVSLPLVDGSDESGRVPTYD
ncbi:folate-binding protein YgfZ [Haladaptatus paucihalophilus DX253]|uniref:Aminomethyltransferase n=1 Tax=Haladaptatus paucihalophilus DX253 TaxID=797209 RepID=E7QU07_HALPU|nr:aminomethyltransferase family protein [Haladaptatus paucihalophilus]EFW92086.1 folate-binding protein YgfZ [Haladaptatus paucihalophilus DX253]SHK88096.1 aminomethyltransferase [Haladaptatus paucihalophilus DX253]